MNLLSDSLFLTLYSTDQKSSSSLMKFCEFQGVAQHFGEERGGVEEPRQYDCIYSR